MSSLTDCALLLPAACPGLLAKVLLIVQWCAGSWHQRCSTQRPTQSQTCGAQVCPLDSLSTTQRLEAAVQTAAALLSPAPQPS